MSLKEINVKVREPLKLSVGNVETLIFINIDPPPQKKSTNNGKSIEIFFLKKSVYVVSVSIFFCSITIVSPINTQICFLIKELEWFLSISYCWQHTFRKLMMLCTALPCQVFLYF